jgi:FkbM family methyltransferase
MTHISRNKIAIHCPNRFSILPVAGELIYVVPGSDLKQHIWEKSGLIEGSLIEWSQQLIPKDKVFVDVGANIGTYTLNYAANPKVSRIHSFEANPEMLRCLTAGLILNGLEDRVETHQVALGSPEQAVQGETTFWFVAGGWGTTNRSIPDSPKWKDERKTSFDVKVRTLDSYGLSNIGLIKLDVECAELDIIRGAVATIENNGWPKLFFECWKDEWFAPHRAQLLDFVASIGYDHIVEISGGYEMFVAERSSG